MRSTWGRRILPFCFVLIFVGTQSAVAANPSVENLFITDVTTVSFSVIWAASEPCTAGLEVYEDATGTIPATSAVTVPHPVNSGDVSIRTTAENNGVMKVMVTGLDADSTYYFRTLTTSKSTNDTTLYPATGLLSVTTEVQTSRTYESGGSILPFSNDIIIEPCYLSDGVTPAAGTLLVATVSGGHYPITSFVGDGVDLPYAIIDLNNVFGRETYKNLDLTEGRNLTLINFSGLEGYSSISHEVPIDNSLAEIKTGKIALKYGTNMISLPLEPDDSTTLNLLDPIIDSVDAVYAFNSVLGTWEFYEVDGWSFLNTLNSLHTNEGYYLFLNTDASLKVYGQFQNNPIPLSAGVGNLVGFRSIETLPLMDALGSVYENLDSIWTLENGQWLFFDKYGWSFLNTLTEIVPGRAYWVFVDQDCEW